MTVELADNCQISPKINGSGIIKSQVSINDETVVTTASQEERRDTAV